VKRALAVMTLWASAAVAQSAPSNVMELLGTTKDGRYVAWRGGDGDPMGGGEAMVVQDLLTGAQAVYLGAADDQHPNQPGPEQFDKWKETHELTALVMGRNAPDKKGVADVVSGAASAPGSWTNGVWSNSATDDWDLVVKRGAKQTVAARCAPASSIDVYWTADGKHTVWLAHHSGHSMRDPGSDNLIVGTDGNVGVAIAVDKAKLKAVEKIAPALSKAGFTVLSVTPAKKPRDKSVVFAAQGHEEDAKKLAAAVPGGAEVQKLDWQSPHDLVVALAADAVK
jgi:hypothetical protein